MKVTNITNVDEFFKVIEGCSGDVYLVSNEGDRINLKSRLSKYLALATVFSSDIIESVELVVSDPEDTKKMLNYMIDGETN